MRLHPNDLFDDVAGLHLGVQEAAENGYSFVGNGLSEEACTMLAKEVDTLTLELGDHINNPINVGTSREITQMHERKYMAIGDLEIPVANFLTHALARRVQVSRLRYPELSSWLPNEAGYQLYRDPNHHISKHRDRRNDELLAATVTISGRARVGIHEALGDPDDYAKTKEIDSCETRAGTVMFLRAKGLGNGEQAIHNVSPPQDGPRLILNLRMRPTILPPPAEFIRQTN